MRRILIFALMGAILEAVALGATVSPRAFSTHYFELAQGGIVRALATDPAGNLFVVSTTIKGTTQSIVVIKTDRSGNEIATFHFGGSGQDYPSVAAIDPNGDLVIGGATASADFPWFRRCRVADPVS